MNARIALFPGSFDPITIAHVDIIDRVFPLFDKIYIGIGLNSSKTPLFSLDTRVEMLEAVFKDKAGRPSEKTAIITYEGLTVDCCKKLGAGYIIRGIRTSADFEYEKAIAQMNHAMQPEIESIFILSKPGYSAISSTIVRDIIRNKGEVSQFVPKEIAEYLKP